MKHKCKMLFLAFIALVSLPTPSASQGDNTALPAIIPPIVINNQQAICPPAETVWEMIDQDIQNTICNTIIPALCRSAQTQASPVASCSALPTSCSSDYYWIRSRNGTAMQVYCDMDRVCGCSSTGGWTSTANLNMSDPSQLCPGEWSLQTYSSEPRRLCGGGNSGAGCASTIYSTYGISYSQVCGRVVGFQQTAPDAFGGSTESIEGPYVDGVSLTHGPPGARQHIWSFAAGLSELVQPSYPTLSCPCVSGTTAPSFVGNDYFCESGNPVTTLASMLYASDPLWDGQGCGSSSCCEFSSPVTAPWFCKQLPQATTDDIEVRICRDEAITNEDSPVQLIELYIRWTLHPLNST